MKTNEILTSDNSLINVHPINQDTKINKNINSDIKNILDEKKIINNQHYNIQKIKKIKIVHLRKIIFIMEMI